jgi:hypothetical protein
LDDVRAVIIAARGVTLSNFISGLLTDAIVLHCDERYQPTPATVLPQKLFRISAWKMRRSVVSWWHATGA